MIKHRKIKPVYLTDYQVLSDLLKNPELYKVDTSEEAYFVLEAFENALNKQKPLGTRITSFIAGESKLSRGIGSVLDFVTFFLPYGNKINTARDAIAMIVGRKHKQKEKPMLKKILNIKGLIKVTDDQGNISFEEIAASVIQIVIAGAVVWSLVELGIYDQFLQLVGETSE